MCFSRCPTSLSRVHKYLYIHTASEACSSITATKIHLFIGIHRYSHCYEYKPIFTLAFVTPGLQISVFQLHSIHACTGVTTTKECHADISTSSVLLVSLMFEDWPSYPNAFRAVLTNHATGQFTETPQLLFLRNWNTKPCEYLWSK